MVAGLRNHDCWLVRSSQISAYPDIQLEEEAMRSTHVGHKLEGRPLVLGSLCEICGKYRNRGNHKQCSKRRQEQYEAGLKK